MKTYLDCIPCFFRQAIEGAKAAGAGEKTQKKIVDELAKILPEFSLDFCPPLMGKAIYGLVKKIANKADPYIEIKRESNKLVLNIYDKLKRKAAHSSDRLLTAVELAIAGNIIDYGIDKSLNIAQEIQKILNEENKAIKKESKAKFDYSRFKQVLSKAKNILYIGDNAGEIVFDKILLEEIKRLDPDKKIIYAVKDKPIINDVLLEDARACGIDKITEVISSGCDAPGTIPFLCSNNFLKIYKKTDMVISKGQGNFEALSSQPPAPTFFLFMAKCPVVAKHIGCNQRDIILSHLIPLKPP
ncbi:MAG: ARMT1-like domain-containing protein [Candidatus Omnitrophota bacterium]